MLLVVSEEPPEPSKIVPTVPRDLETICLKCLQKDIEHRYLTAQDFADELDRYLSGEPILARPISRAQRTLRWCRKNAKMVVAASLVAAVFLVLSGALIYKINSPTKVTQLVTTGPGGVQAEIPEAEPIPDAPQDTSMKRLAEVEGK